MATKLVELQGKLTAKQAAIQQIFEQAKRSDGAYDLLKAEAFQHLDSEPEAREILRAYEKECDDLHAEVTTLQEMHEREQRNLKQINQRKELERKHIHGVENGHGNGQPFEGRQTMTMGQLVRRYWPDDGRVAGGNRIMLDREFKEWDFRTLNMTEFEMKVMTTGSGWAPEVTRIPRVVEFAHRPIQVTDLMPVGNTGQAGVAFMEETTSTLAATEVAENALFPEANFAMTERTVNIRKIAVWLSVTDEQLADVDQVAAFIDARLRFAVQQRLDLQILIGDGVAPNILGFLNTPGIQSQPIGTDDAVEAIYKAMTNVRVTGQAVPSAVILHPANFTPIRLMRSGDGFFLWGPPSEVGPMRVWGVPIVESQAITQGTALTGDFTNFSQLWIRQGAEVLVGYVGDDFKYGRQAIRCTLRAALAVYRPTAFCTVTGLTT
jgi:HK97 family phage major capsid protein